jgi:cell division protein FtsL
MRLAWIIVVLAAIGVSLVHLRRVEMSSRHDIQRLREQTVALRRELQEQQLQLGYLTAPGQVDDRAREMAMEFVDPHAPVAPERPVRLAGRHTAGNR